MSADTETKPLVKKDPYEGVRNEHINIAQVAHETSKGIVNADTARDAVNFILRIKEKRKDWKALVDPVIKSAWESHKKAMALFKEIDQPLKRAEEEIIKPALDKYDREIERVRKEKEDEANRIIREEAERKRKAEDKKRAEDEAKRKENQIVDTAGQPIPSTAPALLPPPPPLPIPVIVIPKEKKPEGVSYVDNWSATVVDLKLLVDAVAAGTLPLEAIQANTSYINQSAKALKSFMNWPGVLIQKQRSVRVSKRRS